MTGPSHIVEDDQAATSLQLDSYLPYRLSVASNAVSGLIARAYEDRFALSVPQWRLMCVLAEDGGLTQREIVARTVMDKVTVSRAARGLAGRRLIARSENESDGRSHVLTLTDGGRRLHAEIAPLALELERRLLSRLDRDERAALDALLDKLADGIEHLADAPP